MLLFIYHCRMAFGFSRSFMLGLFNCFDFWTNHLTSLAPFDSSSLQICLAPRNVA